jgi:AcrR family transcriptional regulator
MTSAAERISRRRAHDAQASRLALLEAARRLFDQQGYEQATTREIGERAGVDPALIARYFGGKEGLFFAAISDRSPDDDVDYEPKALLRFLLERWEEHGHGPIIRSLGSPGLDPAMGKKVSTVLERRVLSPLVEELRTAGAPKPEMRAEVLVALAVGVAVGRANGTLRTLARAPRDRVLAALEPLVDALLAA